MHPPQRPPRPLLRNLFHHRSDSLLPLDSPRLFHRLLRNCNHRMPPHGGLGRFARNSRSQRAKKAVPNCRKVGGDFLFKSCCNSQGLFVTC